MAMARKILGVLAGTVVAGVTVALVEMVGHARLAGDAVFGVVVIGYGLGALAGTIVATRIADRRVAKAVPLILAALAAINLFSFPHPIWFAPAAIAALALGWFLGGRIGPRL